MRLLVLFFVLALAGCDGFEQECKELGGTVIEKSDVAVGIGMNGGVAVVPTSVRFCVSGDGRILK